MLVRDRIEIPDEQLAELCRRYHVRELALFGSVLRDDFRPDSDIDVLAEYEPEARVTLFNHFDLQENLEQPLGRSVDLISKRGLNEFIRDEILASAEAIYAGTPSLTPAPAPPPAAPTHRSA